MPGLPTGGLGAMMGIGLGTELLMQPAPFARDMLEGQYAGAYPQLALETGEEGISGSGATVPCSLSITQNEETFSQAAVFELEKTDGTWYIMDMLESWQRDDVRLQCAKPQLQRCRHAWTGAPQTSII